MAVQLRNNFLVAGKILWDTAFHGFTVWVCKITVRSDITSAKAICYVLRSNQVSNVSLNLFVYVVLVDFNCFDTVFIWIFKVFGSHFRIGFLLGFLYFTIDLWHCWNRFFITFRMLGKWYMVAFLKYPFVFLIKRRSLRTF
mgnify:CR=1 FL=1